MRLGVDAGRQEALERLPGLVDHAERRVPGAGQLGRGLNDPLQERVERELGAQRDPRVNEDAEAVVWSRHRLHPSHLLRQDLSVVQPAAPQRLAALIAPQASEPEAWTRGRRSACSAALASPVGCSADGLLQHQGRPLTLPVRRGEFAPPHSAPRVLWRRFPSCAINHNRDQRRPRCRGATDARRLLWLRKEGDWSCRRRCLSRTSGGRHGRFRPRRDRRGRMSTWGQRSRFPGWSRTSVRRGRSTVST